MDNQLLHEALDLARHVVASLELLSERAVLPENQLEKLERLQEIKGTAAGSRKQAELILDDLRVSMEDCRQRLTAPLVAAIKRQLDRREWGVRCIKCSEASTLLWMKNSRCTEDGSMACSHTTGGKRLIHALRTRMPTLTVVAKRDRRRAN